MNPCRHWFCNQERFHRNDNDHDHSHHSNTTHVYAAQCTRITTHDDDIFFRLACEWNNHDVPGENRTLYYQSICSQCK
jgi:hypothetical protein